MTPQRTALAQAIGVHAEWQQHCDRIDTELAARESDQLKRSAEERRDAEERVKQARLHSPTAEKRALSALLETPRSDALTLEEAEAALTELQQRHDGQYSQISLARRESERLRNQNLAAAAKQRDEAVAAILEAEGLVADLLRRYTEARQELARLYVALAVLPITIRPTGAWETPIGLAELQSGDPALADQIKATIAALSQDASAPLPAAPAPAPRFQRPTRQAA
jgi:hypothetical protein